MFGQCSKEGSREDEMWARIDWRGGVNLKRKETRKNFLAPLFPLCCASERNVSPHLGSNRRIVNHLWVSSGLILSHLLHNEELWSRCEHGLHFAAVLIMVNIYGASERLYRMSTSEGKGALVYTGFFKDTKCSLIPWRGNSCSWCGAVWCFLLFWYTKI